MTYCGLDCCGQCPKAVECGGCENTGGHPFGGSCVAAEWVQQGGSKRLNQEKQRLIAEVNALDIPKLVITDVTLLNGFYVNLAYPLPSGEMVKLLQDQRVYLGIQIAQPDSDRFYGVVGDERFLLISSYGPGGEAPEIILYRKR